MPQSHPPSSSAASRSRRPSERGSRPSSLSGRGLKSAQSSSKRSPRPSAASLARSASPAAPSLYSQPNLTSDKLPSLPAPSTISQTESLIQIPGTYPADSQISFHSDAPDEGIEEPIQSLVEDVPISRVAQRPSPPGPPPIPVTEDPPPPPPPQQEERSTQPAEEYLIPDPEETAHPPPPARSAWTSPRPSPTITRAQTYHPQPQPSPYLQHPYVHSQPVPPHFSAYHYPASYYVPQPHPPHYYPLPPSTVAGSPQITHARVSFSPEHQPASPALSQAAVVPIGMAPMSVPSLERQSSVGSRPGTSGDMAPPASPHGSVASADRGPAVDPGGGGGAAPNDDMELLHRVQSTMSNMVNISAALPDLHQFFSRFRETHGQLGVREEIIRKTEAQQAETLKQKGIHIGALESELESLRAKHSAESNKLRLQIGNLEEKQKESNEKLKELADKRTELSETLSILVEGNVQLQREKESLQKKMDDLRQDHLKERAGMLKDFEASRRAAQAGFEAEKKNMRDEFEERMQQAEDENGERMKQLEDEYEEQLKQTEVEHETIARQTEEEHQAKLKQVEEEHESRLKQVQEDHESKLKQIQEEHGSGLKQTEDDHEAKLKQVESDYEQKLADLTSQCTQEKETMSGEFVREKSELDSNLAAKQQELEQTLAKEREDWQKEREELLKGWQEERETLVQDNESKSKMLAEEHTKNEGSLHAKLKKLEADLKVARNEKTAVTKSKNDLEKGWDSEKAKLERAIIELRGVADNLDKEKSKLQKMVEAFGEITDIRSKGDTYYIDAFRGLSRQIVDLSKELFVHLPTTPPDEVLARVPADVPSFLGDSDASRCIRAAYIQHLISRTLCQRIFHPFLFCVSRRHAKADSLFQAMSNDLRNKSTRKEAIWRQHTLYAAYTAPTAKKTTNSAAGAVVEEIVKQIRPFADPDKLELMYAGVRRIVKTAAQTWRYARLEREMITAHMPCSAGEANSKQGDEWQCDEHDSAGEDAAAGSRRKTLLLRLLPAISREPIHESLQVEKEKADNGCLYSLGVTLCSACPAVQTRLQELQQAKSQAGPKGGDAVPTQSRSPVPPVSPLLPAQTVVETGEMPVTTPPTAAAAAAVEADGSTTDESSDETSGSSEEEEEEEGEEGEE
ncbi:MAG: hypothetical protein M1816_007528 [Peltula sp. TS41687]|nr:MAG: hypothetical protein M1816_007528 [Peltula sp. TS41687]